MTKTTFSIKKRDYRPNFDGLSIDIFLRKSIFPRIFIFQIGIYKGKFVISITPNSPHFVKEFLQFKKNIKGSFLVGNKQTNK